MKKSIKLVTVALLVVLALVGCGANCKEPGCNDEVYKDGYCKYHYALNKGEDTLKGIVNSNSPEEAVENVQDQVEDSVSSYLEDDEDSDDASQMIDDAKDSAESMFQDAKDNASSLFGE